jgi:predicted CXXCH cytochrome family protein
MPFKAGQCQTCHKSGSLDLVKPEKDLCTSCHSKDLTQEPEKGMHVHAPVSEAMCTQCHSPHASDAPKAYWKDTKIAYSCFLCHGKVESSLGLAHGHKPAKDLDCTSCHEPHMSKQKSLLTKDSIELCKGCHKPHAHPVGKKPDGKVVIDPTSNDMLTCVSCHTPHGSDFDMLTKKDRNMDLCTMCHKV